MGEYILDENSLKASLEAAQEELVNLLRERRTIEWRINKLQNDIVHLGALCNVEVEDPIKQLGLTDAIRYILGREAKPLSIPQIIELLGKSSYDISGRTNFSANVHTIVKRLVKSREVALAGLAGKFFVWNSGFPPMPPPPSIFASE